MQYITDIEINTITENDLYEVYRNYIHPLWKHYLSPHGVIAPPEYGTIEAVQLCLLAWDYPTTRVITKTLATQLVRRLGYESNDLQALRHLARQSGYHILQSDRLRVNGLPDAKRGDYRLMSLLEPWPSWNQMRRHHECNPVADECSYCHGRVGEMNRRFHAMIGAVKFYHADPRLQLTPSNRVAQCDVCNRTLQDRYALFPVGHINHGDVRLVLHDLG